MQITLDAAICVFFKSNRMVCSMAFGIFDVMYGSVVVNNEKRINQKKG